MHHLIRKQCFDLTLFEKDEAFKLQQMVSNHFYNTINKVIGGVFDEFSTPDQVWQIERLEIDLGAMTEKEIEKGRWKDLIAKKLEEELRLLYHDSHERVAPQAVSISIAEQWIYYMRFGFLPWQLSRPPQSWYMTAIQSFAANSGAVGQLADMVGSSKTAVTRIIEQYENNVLVMLCEVLTAQNQKRLGDFIPELSTLLSEIRRRAASAVQFAWDERQLRTQLWLAVFGFLAEVKMQATAEKICLYLIERFLDGVNALPVGLTGHLKGNKLSAVLLRDYLRRKKKDAIANDGEGNSESEYKSEKNDSSARTNEVSSFEQTESSRPELPPSIERRHVTAPAQIRNELKEGIYASDCGMILLHPFLDMLFKRLNLMEETRFHSAGHHQKALHFLHYLAWGKKYPEEYELVVPKLLCGYPLHLPVTRKIELKEVELQECEALLRSVIGHWSILKNTSPDGLRESFLQREGKVVIEEDTIYFRVESQAIDILMDHLPWNISMIQLPWLNQLIRVEWR